jgi:hypothetical protein
MSGIALDHPLVRAYLHELDSALGALPAEEACELREQITAHLDDALGAEADDQEIAAVLRRLGSPDDLAAEAAAALAPATTPEARTNTRPEARTNTTPEARTNTAPEARTKAAPEATTRARRHLRLPRMGWRRWVATAAPTVLVAVALGYGVASLIATPLQLGGLSSWWYAKDMTREVDTHADGYQQVTVPIRSGQQQGFVITVVNTSDWTQTVIGTTPDFISPGGPDSHIGVSRPTTQLDRGGGDLQSLTYTTPRSIPPHQTVALRVIWISTTCLASGSSSGIDQLMLRVRVGWFTRTEVIPLDQEWAVSGPSHGGCP